MNRAIRVRAFGGLDERGIFSEELTFSPSMRNYRVTENHTLQKRDGIVMAYRAPAAVTGMWSGYLGEERFFLYTAGGKLYNVLQPDGQIVEIGEVGAGACVLFEFRRRVYIKNASRYSYFDGEHVYPVAGYVPLVAIGCAADGSGSTFEDINLLSSKRRVQYSCSGSDRVYQLPEKPVVSLGDVRYNGELCPHAYTLNAELGTVTFELDLEAGENNLEITYDVGTDRSDVILKAEGVMLFGGDTDGHVFLWGNPSYTGYRFHSELADGQPSADYFPENNYTIVGDSEITDIISQYDRQLIFTKDRAYYSYCELKTDALGNVYASFPVYNLNGEKGSLLKNAGCIMNNEPVTLCADGLNRWSSTTVENERNAVCFSGAVGTTMRTLLASGQFGQMKLFNLRGTGELFFFCGELALIYNYRINAWYAYDHFAVEYLAENDGRLYFSRGRDILVMDPTSASDDTTKVHAYWESPYLSLGGVGYQSKPARLDLMLKINGPAEVKLAYYGGKKYGDETEPKTRVQTLSLPCAWEQFRHVSVRPAVQRFGQWKFRITQEDYSHTELCGLQVTAVQKGPYGRKGI